MPEWRPLGSQQMGCSTSDLGQKPTSLPFQTMSALPPKTDIDAGLLHVRFGLPAQPVGATLYLRPKRWSVTVNRGVRRGLTAAEKTELWDRWQRGESLKAIGRAFGKPSSSIYFQVSPYGGIRPAPRRRPRLALTLTEREEISRGIAGH